MLPIKRKRRFGAPVEAITHGMEDVSSASLSNFSITKEQYFDQNAARVQRRLTKYLRSLNAGLREDGKFFYRFHNSVMVLRDPDSVYEMFSTSGQLKTDLYNPTVIKYFIYPRFWH
jgi:hypothetical protein